MRCVLYLDLKYWRWNRLLAKRLLVLSCTLSKLKGDGYLPALERYTGPSFGVVKKYLRTHPQDSIEILILSARFGLISAETLIPYYEQKMTKWQAEEFNHHLIETLKFKVANNHYFDAFFNLGSSYKLAFIGLETIFKPQIISWASGSIGRRISLLYQWLHTEDYKKPKQETFSTDVNLVGQMNHEIHLAYQIARDAIARNDTACRHFYTWYVKIDNTSVSAKWFASHLLKKQVNSFHTQDALNILRKFGIEVHSV